MITSQAQVEQALMLLPDGEKALLLAMMQELEVRKRVSICQNDFLAFIAAMEPTYKFGTHLKKLGALLMDVEKGTKNRIAVSMAPRFGKSMMISVMYPAWYLGKHPDHKVIVASHTVDLAVVMSRKVRNLMQTPEYRAIFPKTRIASDAKAAGQWSTSEGGEYYACLRYCALVPTTRGRVPAGDILVGDELLNAGYGVRVHEVLHSAYFRTYNICGLLCSAEHPIWTMNRGWVYAEKVTSLDILCVESISDIMYSLLRRLYAVITGTLIPTLVRDKTPLYTPKQREVGGLWRAGHILMRAMARLRNICVRHRGATVADAHHWSDRQQRSVLPGELPMGDARRAGEQQTEQSHDRRGNPGAEGRTARNNPGRTGFSDTSRNISGRQETAEEELQTYGAPENLGWVRACAVWLFTQCCRGAMPQDTREGAKGCLAGVRGAAQDILGVLLGVRLATTHYVRHDLAQPFVNFRTDGDHTFFADGVLTHNCGTGGAIAGRGADLVVADDVLSEQDVKAGNTNSLDGVYDWFTAGLRTRLQPGGRLVVLHTRWHQRDLIGRLLKDSITNPDGDVYESFDFPAILNEGATDEKSLWPEQWSLESLQQTRASMHHILWQWHAQYQQNPTASQSAIIKREWVQWWTKERPPKVDFIVQSYDTALTTNERSDFSVCQTWGVWTNEDGVTHAILLNCVKGKYEFPELKKMAHDQFAQWQPDSVIVEAKASGQPLIDEMRRSGIFVQDYSPGKGHDKIARLNSVSDMFAAGHVWFPETKWAVDVVEEILAFPAGERDDQVDAATLGLIRIRKGGLLHLSSDTTDTDTLIAPRKGYYG